MPIVSTFFSCTDLITGGLILGWFLTILRGILFAVLCIALFMVKPFTEMLKSISEEERLQMGQEQVENLHKMEVYLESNAFLSILMFLTFVGLGLVAAILLIYASRAMKHEYVIPYIIMDTFSVLMWVLGVVESIFDIRRKGFGEFLFSLLFGGLMVYLYVFAISLFQHLRDLKHASTQPSPIVMETLNYNTVPYNDPPPPYTVNYDA